MRQSSFISKCLFVIESLPAGFDPIYSDHVRVNSGASTDASVRGGCPFCRSDHRKNPSFSYSRDRGLYQCFGCGMKGNAYQFLIELLGSPEEAEAEISRCSGLKNWSKGGAPKKSKKDALCKTSFYKADKKITPIRDLKELHPCVGFTTKAALEYIKERIPGLDSSCYESLSIFKWIMSPKRSPDKGARGGLYQRGAAGHQLAVPMWSLEDPDKLSSLTTRWVKPGDPPNGIKTSLFAGAAGGEFGAVFGRIDQAIEASRSRGFLAVTEGDMDTLTLAAMGSAYHVGISGVLRLRRVIEYLIAIGYSGKVVACVDRDKAGLKALEAAMLASHRSLIEIHDGRPPEEGMDLNDLFNQGGSLAVLNLLDDAPPCFESLPDVQSRIRKAWMESERPEIMKLRLEREEHVRLFKRVIDERDSIKEYEDQKKEEEAEKRRALFGSFESVSLCLRLLNQALSETKSPGDKSWEIIDLIKCLFCDVDAWLSERMVFDIVSGALGTREAEILISEAKNKPLDFSNKNAMALPIRRIISKTRGVLLYRFLFELAEATNVPHTLLFEEFCVFRSVHKNDRAWIHAMRAERKSPHESKITTINSCGVFSVELVDDYPESPSYGQTVHTYSTLCYSNQCSYCQGRFVAEQERFILGDNDQELGWKRPMLYAEISVEEDTPEASNKAWKSIASKFRSIDNRSVLRPALKELGFSTGVSVFALDTPENRYRFEKVFDSVDMIEGEEALSRFSLLMTLPALRFYAKVAQREEEAVLDPWLGRYVQSQRRGKCQEFGWLSKKKWAELKKADPGQEKRQMRRFYSHTLSGIVFAEHGPAQEPFHHHEVVRRAGLNEPLQKWIDGQIVETLGSIRGMMAVKKREKARESRREYITRREDLERIDRTLSGMDISVFYTLE